MLEIVREYSIRAIAHASQEETWGIFSSKEKLISQTIAIM